GDGRPRPSRPSEARQPPLPAALRPSPPAPHPAPPKHPPAQSTFCAPSPPAAPSTRAPRPANSLRVHLPAPPDNQALGIQSAAVPGCASTAPEIPTSPPDAGPSDLDL